MIFPIHVTYQLAEVWRASAAGGDVLGANIFAACLTLPQPRRLPIRSEFLMCSH